jgi:DNA polymerase-3 subunit epsilon
MPRLVKARLRMGGVFERTATFARPSGRECELPRRLIAFDAGAQRGDPVTVTLPAWLAHNERIDPMTPTFLVLDTETTGLFDFKKPADDPSQPRLAAVAFIICDAAGEEIEAVRHLVKPDGWTMPPEAQAINGLSTDILDANGVPVLTVLDEYEAHIKGGLIVIGFNAQHDAKMMRAELRRAGRPDLFEETPNVCVMRALKPYKDEGLELRGGFVKLKVACDYFGIPLDEAHEAMADAQAARQILARLIRDGRLPEAKVHYAKTPPVKAAQEAAE